MGLATICSACSTPRAPGPPSSSATPSIAVQQGPERAEPVRAPTLALAPSTLWGCAVTAKTGELACTSQDYASEAPLAAVVLSDWFAAALTREGAVVTWTSFRPGDPSAVPTPAPISGRHDPRGSRFVDLAASREEICVLDEQGAPSCWHWGRFEPRAVETPKALSSIASCGAAVCGTLIDGQLVHIARGLNPVSSRYEVVATPIQRAIGFSSGGFVQEERATGRRLGCGVRQGKIACAGDLSSPFAERMVELGPAIELVANEHAACAISPQRTLRCVRADLSSPFALPALAEVVEVVIGSSAELACARVADGRVRCFDLASDARGPLLDLFAPRALPSPQPK